MPGSRGAAPIFRAVMEYALTKRGEPVLEFERPAGIIQRAVCWESGLLPTPECGRVVNEIFIRRHRADPIRHRLAGLRDQQGKRQAGDGVHTA